jgi:hypothetical protein
MLKCTLTLQNNRKKKKEMGEKPKKITCNLTHLSGNDNLLQLRKRKEK